MNDINFLPPTIIEEQARLQRIVREAILVLAVVVLLAGWHMSTRSKVSQLEDQLAVLQNEMSVDSNQDRELIRLQLEYASLANNAKTQRTLTIPVETLDIIKVIASAMPQDIAVSDLGLRTPPALTEPKHAASQSVQIHLVGLSPNDVTVADFVDALATYPMFENVKMLYSRASRAGEGNLREFRIEMDVPLDRSYRQSAARKEASREG